MRENNIKGITLLDHFGHIKTFMGLSTMVIGFIFFMQYRYGIEDTMFYIQYSIAFWIASSIPQLFIHLSYYLENKDVTIEFDAFSKAYIYTKNGKSIVFYVQDVRQISYTRTRRFDKRLGAYLTWDYYHYAQIMLKESSLTITSLLCFNFNIPVDESKVHFEITSLPTL